MNDLLYSPLVIWLFPLSDVKVSCLYVLGGGSFCYCLEDLSVEEYTHIEMHMDSEGVWMRNPEFKKK